RQSCEIRALEGCELAIVALMPMIGRVQVKERCRLIVAIDEIGIRPILDDDARESRMKFLQLRNQPGDVEARVLRGRGDERSAFQLGRPPDALKVVKSCGTLQVSQSFGWRLAQPFELNPRSELPSHHFDEREIVALKHAEEGRYVATDVIDDF